MQDRPVVRTEDCLELFRSLRPLGGMVADSAGEVVKHILEASTKHAVFLDPSGRRWRRTRMIGIAVLMGLLAVLVYSIPKIWASPAVNGRPTDLPATLSAAGSKPPVVGTGPVVRVLTVRDVGGKKMGLDPFTNRRVVTFTRAEVAKAAGAQHVIYRSGYPAATTKTISLTFDDGPDPRVTPKLLDVLSANKVPATFFVIGRDAAAHQEIIRRMVREGHAVGGHTLTHADVAAEPAWRQHLEMVATGRVLRSLTQEQAGYWRHPYVGDDDKSIRAHFTGIVAGQRAGYTFASVDFDSNDWQYAADPAARAEKISFPNLNDGRNVTVLLHDAGGPNRQRTVDYVKKLIPYAKAHGYTFHSMPQVLPELAASTHPAQPTIWDRVALQLVVGVAVWPGKTLSALFIFAMLAVVLVGFGNAVLAWTRYRRRSRVQYPAPQDVELPTTVVLAAYNEEPVIARTLRSILSSQYPILEVVVVDDGSSDGTADEVRKVQAEDARVVLLQQPNSGKAHALNYGVATTIGEFVVTVDADTIMPPSTVTNMMRHFAMDEAGNLGGVAGVVRVGNREKNLLTRWQSLEYLTQIGIERSAQDALGAISIIPGACAAWRKEAILAAGGYSDITLAEDCDLALTLHHLGWKVTQDDEALAYTEAPETVDDLLAQRTRWTFGTLQAIWKHQKMLFRVRYGALGCFVMPNYVLSVAMPVLFLPFVVAMGWLTLQQQGVGVLLLYFVLFVLAHMVIAAVGVRLMRESYHHLLMVPVYRIVYEPLRAYLLYTSVFLAIKGGAMGWKKLVRTGSMDTTNVNAVLQGGPRVETVAARLDETSALATSRTTP